MALTSPRAAVALSITFAFPSAASAQFGQAWVGFEPAPPPVTSLLLSDALTEVDFAVGDLDRDGWTDVVVVRLAPFGNAGKRPNVLLMNEHGSLVDRSTKYASSSTIPGDNGFNTPTCDRDSVLVDIDGDGWLDIVTAARMSFFDPKHVSHPRVYMNLGEDIDGNWLGLRFEDARIPQLFLSDGHPGTPNFNAVAAGDITGDGVPDLFFADHDGLSNWIVVPPGAGDMNCRLLVNDGGGYFIDESTLRVDPATLNSTHSNATAIVDMNLDGLADIIKHNYITSFQSVAVAYNDPLVPGTIKAHETFHTFAANYVAIGDLNNDGRPDAVMPDDGFDRYRLNTGTDALGRAIWGPANTFNFLTGGDDGFAGRAVIADLDGDGWNDVLIADVDHVIMGYNRRLHIYHNRITVPGQIAGTVLREERENATSTGWIGAVGLTTTDLTGTYDVAVFDLDRDGDMDLLIGRSDGAFLWRNTKYVCQENLGGAAPNGAYLSVCGDPLVPGGQATLRLEGTSPNTFFVLAVGGGPSALPLFGGSLVVFPVVTTLLFQTGPLGTFTAPVNGGPVLTAYIQAATLEGPDVLASNGVKIVFAP